MNNTEKLITLINSDELYDAKEQLDKVTKDKIKVRREEISKNMDIFNKNK